MQLDALVGQPGFDQLPDGVQAKAIGGIISKSRERAAALIQMQNPEIIQQAMQNKRTVLMEGRAALR